MHPAALPVVTALLAAAPPAAHGCKDELFRIARSKNANVVVYEVVRRPDGTIDPADPVHASWIMLARTGEREGLNLLERTLAYGFEVRPAAPEPGWWLVLKAEKKRPLHVVEVDGCPAAVARIGGREGALRLVYVKADDGRLIPNVEYVEVTGVDPATGAELRERLFREAQEVPRPEWQGG